MRSTVDSTKVGFSAGARIFSGATTDTEAALRPVGLLGADATLNIGQTTRQKMDRFPQVVVAQAILQQSAQMQAVLHEVTKENLRDAFGLETADLTDTTGGDTNVVDEAQTLDANNNIVLKYPIKTGGSATVKNTAGSITYVAGTDYLLIPRDTFGRTVIYRLSGGAITAGQALKISYTYVAVTQTKFPIGNKSKVVEHKVKLEEEYTDGRKLVAVLYRAVFSINGNLTVNTDGENGMSIPVTIEGLYDATANAVADIYLVG